MKMMTTKTATTRNVAEKQNEPPMSAEDDGPTTSEDTEQVPSAEPLTTKEFEAFISMQVTGKPCAFGILTCFLSVCEETIVMAKSDVPNASHSPSWLIANAVMGLL